MSKSVYNCDLKSCYLCKFCLKDWLPAVEVHKKNFEIKKGQQIFKEGDEVTGIYFVYSGNVKVHKQWGKEKELILRFAQKGDILGHLGLGKNGIYPVSATAIEPAIVCYVDRSFFESTLNINNQLTHKLLLLFADELQRSEKRMSDLAHMPVKGRVAQALISLKDQFGVNNDGYIDIELSRQNLAAFTGAVYESLFRTINELVNDKVIQVAGKQISIKNEEMLLKLTEEVSL